MTPLNAIPLIYFIIKKKKTKKTRNVILNRLLCKDYYENDKERLRQQARDKYRNLSEEEKK